MAQSQKLIDSPLIIPHSLALLVKAFATESKESAKALIAESLVSIYSEGETQSGFERVFKSLPKPEIEEVYNLMKAIKPSSFIESIRGSQMIISHVLGMRKLSQSYQDDQKIGLKLLRASNDAIEDLKRNYNNNSPSK